MNFLGTTLGGRYELTKLLGEGGLGQVYLAEQQSMGRKVAVKLLHPEVADNEHAAVRFEREALAASRVTHPNVVAIYDFGAEELAGASHLYLVMEYLEGQDLFDRLCQRGRLPAREAVRVLSQILSPLLLCHRAGIMHRDLKPGNVMLCESSDGEFVKLLDFGVAKMLFDNGPSVTRSGQPVGTPFYMAPEQIGQNKLVGPSADLYAVGVILYELLTGEVPFSGENQLEVFRQHFYDRPPTLREKLPEAFHLAPFDPVIQRAMEKLPEERFADAGEFSAALSAALSASEDLARLGQHPAEATLLDIRLPWLESTSAELFAGDEATVPMAPVEACLPLQEEVEDVAQTSALVASEVIACVEASTPCEELQVEEPRPRAGGLRRWLSSLWGSLFGRGSAPA